ncbi:hypothetical protein [Candidatus Agathobaculum pullicola]|uniref:hypothetical protein n=1 Tax=Candidatus Agathobaculum pullicola TaxID=2838426 RepID=UPI003F8DEAD7
MLVTLFELPKVVGRNTVGHRKSNRYCAEKEAMSLWYFTSSAGKLYKDGSNTSAIGGAVCGVGCREHDARTMGPAIDYALMRKNICGA